MIKAFQGCGSGLVVAVLGIGMLLLFNDAPVAKPGAAVHPAMVIGVVVGGIALVVAAFNGAGLKWLLIAFAIGGGLIVLNGTDAMPTVDNPCPGYEVAIKINGQCKGLDADANRQWLADKLGVQP